MSKRKTVYAVQTFSRAKGGFTIDPPMPAQSADHARRIAARRLSQKVMGAVAFSRAGDEAAGEFDAPVILAEFGKIPLDLAEIAA